jgi:hypothetical protein
MAVTDVILRIGTQLGPGGMASLESAINLTKRLGGEILAAITALDEYSSAFNNASTSISEAANRTGGMVDDMALFRAAAILQKAGIKATSEELADMAVIGAQYAQAMGTGRDGAAAATEDLASSLARGGRGMRAYGVEVKENVSLAEKQRDAMDQISSKAKGQNVEINTLSAAWLAYVDAITDAQKASYAESNSGFTGFLTDVLNFGSEPARKSAEMIEMFAHSSKSAQDETRGLKEEIDNAWFNTDAVLAKMDAVISRLRQISNEEANAARNARKYWAEAVGTQRARDEAAANYSGWSVEQLQYGTLYSGSGVEFDPRLAALQGLGEGPEGLLQQSLDMVSFNKILDRTHKPLRGGGGSKRANSARTKQEISAWEKTNADRYAEMMAGVNERNLTNLIGAPGKESGIDTSGIYSKNLEQDTQLIMAETEAQAESARVMADRLEYQKQLNEAMQEAMGIETERAERSKTLSLVHEQSLLRERNATMMANTGRAMLNNTVKAGLMQIFEQKENFAQALAYMLRNVAIEGAGESFINAWSCFSNAAKFASSPYTAALAANAIAQGGVALGYAALQMGLAAGFHGLGSAAGHSGGGSTGASNGPMTPTGTTYYPSSQSPSGQVAASQDGSITVISDDAIYASTARHNARANRLGRQT